jgi:uncharacterized protein (DUF1697 family)
MLPTFPSGRLDVNRYVAFMRAINVAGHASVRMSDVREAFAAAGCRNVRTYIQSGNIVFESPAREAAAILQKARRKLRHVLDDEPDILCRTVREIEDLVRQTPFKNIDAGSGIKLYVAFLSQKPRRRPQLPLVSPKEALEAIAMSEREVFVVSRRKRNGFFGFPNNFVEQELGVSATTRNWSTITKIAAFVQTEADDGPGLSGR